MTTEIALNNAVEPPAAMIAQNLNQHVAALKAAHEIAGLIHKTVQAYDGGTDNKGKKRPGRDEAAVAIYHGQLIGMDPIQSLQNIFVVHGTPSMYARTMKALLLRAGHHVETVETTDKTATVRAKHHSSAKWEEVTWTIQRAECAGYTSNTKYKTDPEGMLYARALADACRRAAPDVLLGMATSREELETEPEPPRETVRVHSERVSAADILGETAADPVEKPDTAQVTPPAQDDAEQQPAESESVKKAPAKRAAVKRAEGASSTEPGKITAEQLTEAAKLFERAGITERADNREFLAALFGRPVDDPRTLTQADGDYLLEQLASLPPADGEQLPGDGENGGQQ